MRDYKRKETEELIKYAINRRTKKKLSFKTYVYFYVTAAHSHRSTNHFPHRSFHSITAFNPNVYPLAHTTILPAYPRRGTSHATNISASPSQSSCTRRPGSPAHWLYPPFPTLTCRTGRWWWALAGAREAEMMGRRRGGQPMGGLRRCFAAGEMTGRWLLPPLRDPNADYDVVRVLTGSCCC